MFTWTFNALTGFRPHGTPALPVPVKPESAPARGASTATAACEGTPNPHLAGRRAQALQRMFPKLLSWFASRRDSLCIGEINEYLAQASNVTDLEQRIRAIEQQRHFS